MKKNNSLSFKTFGKSGMFLIASSLLVSFIFFLYAPLELFFTNFDEFWFRLRDFWWIPLTAFAIAFLIIFTLGCFLPEKLRYVYACTSFGGGLALYIQGNFLNIKIGKINGAAIDWTKYSVNFIVDIVIWILIVAVPIILYLIFKKKIVKVFTVMAAFLFLMQSITLGTLIISKSKNDEVKATSCSLTEDNLFNLSSDQNAVVFLLDMFDNRYFRQILNEKPQTTNQFQDFTYFDNAIGSYSTTAYSVGALYTGIQNHNEEGTFIDCINNQYKKTKMFDDLINRDFKIDLYSYMGLMPTKLINQASNCVKVSSMGISDYKGFTKKIYRLALCRYAPDIFKQKYWMDGTEFEAFKATKISSAKPYSDDNLNFYDSIKSTEFSISNEKRFKFIHIAGAHYPYKIDSEANPIASTSDNSYALGAAEGSLKIVKTYINKMKALNVYDNSTIIIMADHGYYWDGVLTNPLMMVKESNAHKSFSVSEAPVSHYDFHATVMSGLGYNDNNKYGKSMLDIQSGEQRDRIFYQYNLGETAVDSKYRLIEYSVADDNNLRKSFALTGKEYTVNGKCISHFDNCKYCLSHGTDPVDEPNDQEILHSQK